MDGCTVVVVAVLGVAVAVVGVRGGGRGEVMVAVEGACAVVGTGVVHLGLLVLLVVMMSRGMDAIVAVGAEALF
jgi:hypothetical protein